MYILSPTWRLHSVAGQLLRVIYTDITQIFVQKTELNVDINTKFNINLLSPFGVMAGRRISTNSQ
jgi:hypothetical protein